VVEEPLSRVTNSVTGYQEPPPVPFTVAELDDGTDACESSGVDGGGPCESASEDDEPAALLYGEPESPDDRHDAPTDDQVKRWWLIESADGLYRDVRQLNRDRPSMLRCLLHV
jgi:hypothetical protein